MTEQEIRVVKQEIKAPYVQAMKEADSCLDCARKAIVRANNEEGKPGKVSCLGEAVEHLDGADTAARGAMSLAVTNSERFWCKVLSSQIGNVRDLINDRVSAL